MPKRLLVTAGPDRGRVFELGKDDEFLIGRSKATPTRLADPHVSRVHCQLHRAGDQFTLADNDSASGTFVNGQRVTEHRLRPGDVIAIGETQLVFEDQDVIEPKTLPPDGRTPRPASPDAASLSDLTGKKISHYTVGALLARGANGFVFRAQDPKENTEVALKVLRPEIAQDEEEIQRFVRAMKTMLPLRHPNLVAILGAGKTSGFCWLAMEFVDGESLAAVIQRIGVAGMLDWRYALRVATHIGRALAFAEKQHIIHRNITPTNILVRSSDKLCKLGDLMLAKALEGTLAQQITRPGELLGDVAYMSPERTQSSGVVDGRSDIYSLGATTYALLTGRPPFIGQSLPDTIAKIRQEEPVRPKKYHLSVPDSFEGIVLQMLAKRPEGRFQSAADLMTQLERVATFNNVQV